MICIYEKTVGSAILESNSTSSNDHKNKGKEGKASPLRTIIIKVVVVLEP